MMTLSMGETQRDLLDLIKRRGHSTIPDLAAEVGLNIETIRQHLKALVTRGLVRRKGRRSDGPGRPEVVYGLTPKAEEFYPRGEGDTLREFAAYLVETGHGGLLKEFFEQRIGGRRQEALARVRHLEGRERLEEVARMLSELGFMAVVEDDTHGSQLRLCHCPIRELVRATPIPCVAEIGLLRELVGESLTRMSYIPAGEASCSYRPVA